MTTAARAQALARKSPTPIELERRHGARNYDPLKVVLELDRREGFPGEGLRPGGGGHDGSCVTPVGTLALEPRNVLSKSCASRPPGA